MHPESSPSPLKKKLKNRDSEALVDLLLGVEDFLFNTLRVL